MKAQLAIYNLNGKVTRWWRDFKHTKKDELREIRWDNFQKIFQEKYMSKSFFDRKVKEFHELRMGYMTMDAFINIFLDLLHYVPYVKDEKLKIQQFLGCLPPNFRERIEFDTSKTFDTTLHKSRLFYEHGKLRQEKINRSRDRSRTFLDNRKPGFNPPPYRKHNNGFPSNKNFNKKVKEFHELRMGSMTMDAFINIFLDLLHYVPYIKDEKGKDPIVFRMYSSQLSGKD